MESSEAEDAKDTDPSVQEVVKNTDVISTIVHERTKNYNVSRKLEAVTGNRNKKKRTVSNPLDGKWIHVYVNGDEHFTGLKCVVNSKYYRNFDAFLGYLTERLRPGFGVVRNIYTPFSGHAIQSLEELKPRQKYVVAGSEKFRKLEPGYADIGFKSVRKSEPKTIFKRNPSSLKPRAFDQNPVTFYFYKNGIQRMKPLKMIFQARDLGNFERIFDKLKTKIQCGSVKRLYMLNGRPVNSLNELQNGQSYVVVEKYEVFKPVNYGIQMKEKHFGNDCQKKLISSENARNPLKVHKSANKRDFMVDKDNKKIPSVKSADMLSEKGNDGVVDQDNLNISSAKSPVTFDQKESESLVKQNGKNIPIVESPIISDTKGETIKGKTISNLGSSAVIDLSDFSTKVNSVSNYQPSATYELSFEVKEVDLDVDLGGVYRARERYCLTEGATEIQDDGETAVEFLPADLDAEEIEDEEEEQGEEMTPDMERSMQHLTLDPPDELVAFLPSMQGKQPTASNERTSSDKYNLSQSQTFDRQNLII